MYRHLNLVDVIFMLSPASNHSNNTKQMISQWESSLAGSSSLPGSVQARLEALVESDLDFINSRQCRGH